MSDKNLWSEIEWNKTRRIRFWNWYLNRRKKTKCQEKHSLMKSLPQLNFANRSAHSDTREIRAQVLILTDKYSFLKVNRTKSPIFFDKIKNWGNKSVQMPSKCSSLLFWTSIKLHFDEFALKIFELSMFRPRLKASTWSFLTTLALDWKELGKGHLVFSLFFFLPEADVWD